MKREDGDLLVLSKSQMKLMATRLKEEYTPEFLRFAASKGLPINRNWIWE